MATTVLINGEDSVLANEEESGIQIEAEEKQAAFSKSEPDSSERPEHASEGEEPSPHDSSRTSVVANGEPSSGVSLNSSSSSDEHEFRCKSCTQKFTGQEAFYAHVEAKPPCWERKSKKGEPGVLIKSARCRWCQKTFPSVEACYSHLENNECPVRLQKHMEEANDDGHGETDGDDEGEDEDSDSEAYPGKNSPVKAEEAETEEEEAEKEEVEEDDDDRDGWVGEGYEHGSGDEADEHEDGDEEEEKDNGDDEEAEDSKTACPMCPATLGNSFLLECHIISEHNVTSTARIRLLLLQAAEAKKKGNDDDGQVRYNSHEDPMHCYDPVTGVFKCAICPGTFTTALLLCKHLLATHSVFFSSMCQFCGLGSSQAAKIAEHEKVCAEKPPGSKTAPAGKSKPAAKVNVEVKNKGAKVEVKNKGAKVEAKNKGAKVEVKNKGAKVEVKNKEAKEAKGEVKDKEAKGEANVPATAKKPKTKAELRAQLMAASGGENNGSAENVQEAIATNRSASAKSSSTPDKPAKKRLSVPQPKSASRTASSKSSTPPEEAQEDEEDEEEEAAPAVVKATLNRKTGKFKCDLCGKETTLMSRMRSHFRIHTGEQPYKCRICNRAFAHSSNRSTHEKMHKVNRELEKMKSFPCFDCPATFSNFPSLCEHSKMHSVTLRPAAVESTKISAAAVAKNRILKKAIRGKIEFSSNRPKSLKKTAHYCTVCSPPRAFGQAISLRSHLEQFHRAVIKDTKFVTKNGKTGTLDECESEVEVPKQIVKEDPADLIKNELPVADRKYQVRPMVRRRRKIYECVRCQEQFHDEYSHTQHVLAHDRSENATCRMCDPPEEFKGESAYWRHLRSAHGVTAAGRLHPVKMHPAGKKLQEALIKEEEADEGQLGEFVEELDEDVEMEEGPTLTAQLEQDLEEEEVDEEEVEKFWHQQLAPIGSLPLAVQDDDLGPVDEDKRKPGQVAAKRPRSIFQSLDSPSKAENQHEEDNDSGDDDDVMETDEPDDDEEEGVKVARALHEEEMLKLGVFVQSEKRYRCLICGRAVGGRAKLVAHASNHSRKQLLSCPECPKSFREPESLEHHLEEHEVKVKRGYRCKICMEAFTSANWKVDFLEHMREHLGPEACVCEVCSPPEHFSDADDLQAHIDAVHGFEKDETTDEEGNDDRAEEEDDVLVDEDDDVVVEKDDDVVEEDDDVVAEEDDDVVAVEDYHVRADVPVAVKTEPKLPSLNSLDVYPQCTHCPARFINLRAVENHIRVAHELPEKPATAVVTTVRAQVGPTAAGSESECGHCRKLFIHHDALEAHVRQEHPEGNSKGSKRANSMPERAKADMVSSQDACDPTLTDQTCPYCRAQFETHRQLAGHFLQHSWNRPAGLQKSDKRYPCKFCPEVFRALYQLVVHVNDGHADAPAGIFDFQCEECGDYFINPLKLHLHMAKLHAGEPPKNPRNMKFGGNMPWKSSPSKAGMGERSSMTPPKAAVKKRTPTVVKSAPAKTGSGDFGCHICESRFETSRGLAGHISRRHGKQASPGDRRANEGDHDEESRSPPAKKAKVSLDEASDYDVIYCKHCNVAYGGSTRKYHLNCPGKLSPPPSDVAEQSSGNMSDTKLAPSGTPTKDVEIVEQDKCPDCNLSYIFESPEKHVNACPLGPRRVVVSPRGLKTYRNQSVCVSAMDRSMTMEMLAGGDKQFRVIEVSSKRIRKPSLKMLDVYDTQASQKVEAANRKWLCTPRKQHPANYTSVETQTNDSDFDDDEASPSYPTGAFCGKCGEKFSGRLSRIGHDKNCPGLSPFLRSVKGKPDPLAASTSDAAATDGEHKPSLENVVVKDEVFPMSDDEAATNMVEDMLES